MDRTYEFTVFIEGVEYFSDDALDRLYEAGCDDGSPGRFAGELFIEFDRTAVSLEKAIRSAIDDVQSAGFKVKRVELDDDSGPSNSLAMVNS